MSKVKKTAFNLFKGITILLLVFLSACQSAPAPAIRETGEFYINDRSHILLNATAWTILAYGRDLYIDSHDQASIDQSISGSQVVVATYVGEVGSIDTTEIFNSWGIGDNDMGILIVLFFSLVDEEYVYNDMVFEIGLRMEGYLSAFDADAIITQYFDDPSISEYDYDQRIVSLYFGVLEHLYLNVYDYTTFDFQNFIDEYNSIKYEYLGPLPSSYEKESLPTWAWILIIIGVVGLGIIPGGYMIPFIFFGGRGGRGGGGRSGGYWFRR